MSTVFMAGSLSIKRLHPLFIERIKNVIESGFKVIVGDADGADTSIQDELFRLNASAVTVYSSSNIPRNNVGSWPIKRVASEHSPGSRAYFTAKDVEMARVADYGLMIWDAKSTGTLNNVIELLKNERSSRIFINKKSKFYTVSDANGLRRLIEIMSDDARSKAESKINLEAKIDAIEHKQFTLSL